MKSAERVRLKPRQIIQERNLPLRHAYFIESGIASLQMWRGQGLTVEARTVGSNDLVGLSILLGTWRSPRRCVVQVGGDALRIPAGELAAFVEECPTARSVFLAYVHAAIGHSAQLLSCNTCHSVKDRVVRWLLTVSDQLRSTDVPVTHSCIARSLGVRRASVTNVAGDLEGENLIRQERGLISFLNSEELERRCCGCYRAIRDGYERLPRIVQAGALTSSIYADSSIAA
jgi:CRP-like cAMP-binding protein